MPTRLLSGRRRCTCADAMCLVPQRAEVAIHAVGARGPLVASVALAGPVPLPAAVPTAPPVPTARPLGATLARCGRHTPATQTPAGRDTSPHREWHLAWPPAPTQGSSWVSLSSPHTPCFLPESLRSSGECRWARGCAWGDPLGSAAGAVRTARAAVGERDVTSRLLWVDVVPAANCGFGSARTFSQESLASAGDASHPTDAPAPGLTHAGLGSSVRRAGPGPRKPL